MRLPAIVPYTPHPMPALTWLYPAQVQRVVDGDTAHFMLDLGFAVYLGHDFRFADINAPELHGTSSTAGLVAKQYAEAWLSEPGPWPYLVSSTKLDKYGRYLALIWRVRDGACLNDDMVASGNAVPYMVTLP